LKDPLKIEPTGFPIRERKFSYASLKEVMDLNKKAYYHTSVFLVFF
jgi:hypothetical protein